MSKGYGLLSHKGFDYKGKSRRQMGRQTSMTESIDLAKLTVWLCLKSSWMGWDRFVTKLFPSFTTSTVSPRILSLLVFLLGPLDCRK